jgi:hypothetical protein
MKVLITSANGLPKERTANLKAVLKSIIHVYYQRTDHLQRRGPSPSPHWSERSRLFAASLPFHTTLI